MGKKRKDANKEGNRPQFHHEAVEAAHIKLAALGTSLILGFGPDVRLVYEGKFVPTSQEEGHKGFVRDVALSHDGKYAVSGGDDKHVKLWDMATGKCLATLTCPKKVSAVTFTPDASHFFFADKFGDVFSCPVQGPYATTLDELCFLQGHFCTIVTSLRVSPCGKLLASTEKDTKCRVTWLPHPIERGDGEIQAFCVGHRDFTSACEFVNVGQGRHLIATASGDGTVALWDYSTGRRVDSLEVASLVPGETAAEAAAPGSSAKSPAFVHALSVSGSVLVGLVTADLTVAGVDSGAKRPTSVVELHCTESGFDRSKSRVIDLGPSGVVGAICHGGQGLHFVAEMHMDADRKALVPGLRTVQVGGSAGEALGFPAELTAPGRVLEEKEVRAGVGYCLSEVRKKAANEEFKAKLEERKARRNDRKSKQRKLEGGAAAGGEEADEDEEGEEEGEGGSGEDE